MRRAMRHGKRLGITEPFLHEFVAVLVRHMGHAYPELPKNQAMIEQTIVAEEHRFEAVLTDGLPRLETEIAKALETPARVLPGDAAFRLYDTFGVPFDFIEDTAATQDVRVDREGYDRAMDEQRRRARAQSAFGERSREEAFALAKEDALRSIGDQFEGYVTSRVAGIPVLALFDGARRSVETLAAGSTGFVLLPQTPFYLEAGGQVSDSGRIVNDATGASASVEGMVRVGPGLPRAHHVRVTEGALHVRDIVRAEIDDDARAATRRNHTATHLLHAALRQVLGAHVKQAGSLVAPDRLRFDFVHFQPVTREQIERIERLVAEQIVRNAPVETRVRPTEEAIAEGAMALFGEKYGDMVRVVSVADFSRELCGGTHVTATGDIGSFVILAEGGVAAGVRRIEAVTGLGALAWLQQLRRFREDVLEVLKVGEHQAIEVIERLQADAKRLARELTQMKAKLAVGGSDSQSALETVEVAGVRLARRKVEGLDKDALRSLADSLKASIKSGVVVIASASDGKVQVVVAVTPDVTSKIKAGQIVKEIAPLVGGAGGGRPDFAEAGGKEPEKIDDLLRAAPQVIEKLLNAR
jgi:alanyl-tRNA synthetase